jgi:hypothetical protein
VGRFVLVKISSLTEQDLAVEADFAHRFKAVWILDGSRIPQDSTRVMIK